MPYTGHEDSECSSESEAEAPLPEGRNGQSNWMSKMDIQILVAILALCKIIPMHRMLTFAHLLLLRTGPSGAYYGVICNDNHAIPIVQSQIDNCTLQAACITSTYTPQFRTRCKVCMLRVLLTVA